MNEMIPSRGAIAEPLTMEVTRDLTPQDLLRLGDAPKVGPPVIQKLRQVHHRQAQLLAQGRTPTDISVIVGCTVQRIVQLQNDPMFMELVSYYQDQILVSELEASKRIQEKIVDAGEMAIDEISLRLEDDDKRSKMRTDELRKIAEFAMDRTVAPPKATPQQTNMPAAVTINFGTSLREAKPTIEATIESEDKGK